MAYNLPPPWDPGFSLPINVKDEGLERRAFVTRWQRRGTYDDPTVGTGGYAVPKYVLDEGYGQGTFVTKWLPRGYYGPGVPNWLNKRPKVVSQRRRPGGGVAIHMDALSGTDAAAVAADPPLPKEFQAFGDRGAAEILSRIAHLPPPDRKPTLRKIMNQVDKSLWKRTADIAKRYTARGMEPGAALEAALSRALGTGMMAELIETGRRRRAPQPNTLLGLGCSRGRAALGATPMTVSKLASSQIAVMAQPQSTEGETCQEGFTWDNGAWRRMKAGETAKCAPASVPKSDVVIRGDGDSGKPTVTDTTDLMPQHPFDPSKFSHPPLPDERIHMTIGGSRSATTVELPADVGELNKFYYSIATPNGIPTPWRNALYRAIRSTRAVNTDGKNTMYTYNPNLPYFQTVAGKPDWMKALSVDKRMADGSYGVKLNHAVLQGGCSILAGDKYATGAPFASFTHPKTNDKWGLYVCFRRKGGKNNDISDKTGAQIEDMVILARRIEPGFWSKIWEWIEDIPAKLWSLAKDAVNAIGDLACATLGNPQIGQATAAGAHAAGGPAAGVAGLIGTQIAQAKCGGQPLPELPPPPPSDSWLLPIAILGVGGAAIFLMSKKKKP